MRTQLMSFSIAALFSLATACAVDEPDALSLDTEDAAECVVGCRDADGDEDAKAQRRRVHEYLLRLQQAAQRDERMPELEGFCEQDADCESNVCDEELSQCGDDPV